LHYLALRRLVIGQAAFFAADVRALLLSDNNMRENSGIFGKMLE
jgi:hypothetical protein